MAKKLTLTSSILWTAFSVEYPVQLDMTRFSIRSGQQAVSSSSLSASKTDDCLWCGAAGSKFCLVHGRQKYLCIRAYMYVLWGDCTVSFIMNLSRYGSSVLDHRTWYVHTVQYLLLNCKSSLGSFGCWTFTTSYVSFNRSFQRSLGSYGVGS